MTDFTWWSSGGVEVNDDAMTVTPDFPYWPLREHTGLFRDFAQVSPTPEGFRQFALGHGGLFAPGHAKHQESLASWERERSDMARSVSLLKALPALGARAGREDTQEALACLVNDSLARHGVTLAIVHGIRPYGIGMRSSFLVRDLAGALWLQVAVAAIGDRVYEPCPICKRYYDATDAPTSKLVCSVKCRNRKAYLARKGGETP